jgi:glutaredoxin 1
VDIHAEGITKADLEKTVGKPVETVPQIFVDQKHIGGCTDFEAWPKRIWACLPPSNAKTPLEGVFICGAVDANQAATNK